MVSYDEAWEIIAESSRISANENKWFHQEIIEEIRWLIESNLKYCYWDLKDNDEWKLTKKELENRLAILEWNLKIIEKENLEAEVQRAYEIVLSDKEEINIWFSATLMYTILCKLVNRQP